MTVFQLLCVADLALAITESLIRLPSFPNIIGAIVHNGIKYKGMHAQRAINSLRICSGAERWLDAGQ